MRQWAVEDVKKLIANLHFEEGGSGYKAAGSITLDIWSSRANRSYLGLLLHYVDDTFTYSTKCLVLREFPKQHTGVEVWRLIRQVADFYDLSLPVIVAGVSDSGSNMVSAMANAPFPHERCAAHQIQRIIITSINTLPQLVDMLKKVKKLIRFFNKSPKATEYLRASQEHTQTKRLKFIQSNATRWNSLADMAERYLELKEVLDYMYR